MSSELQSVLEALEELKQDAIVPKNIKLKIDGVISLLDEDVELSIKVNKALNLLDEISDDSNLKSYTRTQIWNIVSLLEKI